MQWRTFHRLVHRKEPSHGMVLREILASLTPGAKPCVKPCQRDGKDNHKGAESRLQKQQQQHRGGRERVRSLVRTQGAVISPFSILYQLPEARTHY